ncbi:MAG: clan AA aspartic protease [Chitinophagaceae bacterium]|nr:MAG: clan AA aspartic protease [Chitinophagaceae bacterium]
MDPKYMGLVYADIDLANGEELLLVRRNIIDRDEVKRLSTNMLVDSGSLYMCINEHMQELLQLPWLRKHWAQLADGQRQEYDLVGPVEVRFKNRVCHASALVLPGDSEPLLGVLPMEEMDVLVHPQRQELIVHPDHPEALARL